MLHKLLACVILIFFSSSLSLAQEPKRPIAAVQAISTLDFGYLPTLLARAKGFFVQEGLDLKLLVVSVRVSVPALMSREVHFAAAGSSMPAALKGAPLKAIYYTYKTSTFQLIVRPEIVGPQNLKGKSIAVSSPGSSNDHAARLMLKKLGLEPGRDATLLSSGDSQARLLAMESNLAAGSAVNPDVAAHLAPRGYRILMNSADVYPVPFSGMAVHEGLIQDNPELIKRWLRAHIRAILHIRKNPEDAAQVAAKELRLTPEVALRATKLLLPAISADDPGGFTENAMRLNLEYSASRQGGDASKVAITQVADVNLLREVQREMGIRCKDGYQCK
jgi:ABC-type nitrate/sulfonate/bicarbonate transport system substrate-binding protein